MERRELLKYGAIVGTGVGGLAVVGAIQNNAETDSPRAQSDSELPARGGDREGFPIRGEPTGETPTAGSNDADSGEPAPRFAGEFSTVVDAVAAGADPEGEEPINDVLQEQAGDDTLLSFPAGNYRVRPTRLTGYSRFGIAAAFDSRPTFFGDPGSFSGNDRFLVFEDVSEFLLYGVDFDFCRGGTGGKLTLKATGDLTVSNVSVAASCSSDLQVLGISVCDEESVGLVERFRAVNQGGNQGLTGVYVGSPHAGELTFRNCELWGFTDNGLYASAPGLADGENGTVHVDGGSYGNSNVSNVRLGTEGSSARGVTVRVDESPGYDPANVRGIRLRHQHSQLIENCEIVYTEDASKAFGAIVFHPNNAGATVRDTDITIDRDDVAALWALQNQTDRVSSLLFENVSIEGSASGGYAAEFLDRGGVVFRNCTVRQTGEDRNGIRFVNQDGCRIVDSHIDVTGEPVVVNNTTAQIENTTVATRDGEKRIQELTVDDQTVIE